MDKQKKIIINEGGITGSGEGLINQNSKEFKVLQKLIKKQSSELSESVLIENRLLSLRFQMETYLNNEHPKELKNTGSFLKAFVEALRIKKKSFAEYIGFKESNLSAIFKGTRKINTDLAIKFGEIFNIDPILWLHIQSKNELLEIMKKNKEKYQQYKLEDLLNNAN